MSTPADTKHCHAPYPKSRRKSCVVKILSWRCGHVLHVQTRQTFHVSQWKYVGFFFQACTWIYLIFFNFCSLYSWGHSIWKLVSKSHDLVLPLFPPLSKPFHLSLSLCHNIRVSISTCYIIISANIILDTHKLTQLSVSLFHNICVSFISTR